MPRVFISHSSQDHELVEREIISPLRAHGVETWYSTDNIRSASEWERQIRMGLKESDWFLIALTPRSVASEWVGREVHWAFLKRKERIIPVMLETCEPDELHLGLLPLQFVDFRNDSAKAQDQLLAVWGLNRAARVETHYRAAQDALARQDWDAAVELLEAVLRLDPAHARAGAELERARRRQELDASYEAGINDLRNGRWRDALAALRRVQDVDGEYKDVAGSIALAESELQKEEAAQLYRGALDAAGREEWAEAAGRFEAVLKLDPSHAEAQTALARVRQQTELAELYASGREHLRAERWREALKSFRRVRAIDKSYGGVADLIAEADAGLEEEETRRSQREEEGRKAKEEAERQERERLEKDLSERKARERLYREALEAFDREDWGAAGEKLRAAQAADPDNKGITAKLAEVAHQQKLDKLFDGGMQHMENERWAEALGAFLKVRQAGRDNKYVSAQIARAEAGLRSLREKERERLKQQATAETTRTGREKTGSAREIIADSLDDETTPVTEPTPAAEPTPAVEQTPDAGNSRRSLFIVGAVLLGALLIISAFALWGEGTPRLGDDLSNDAYVEAGHFYADENYVAAESMFRKAIELHNPQRRYVAASLHNGLGGSLFHQSKYKEAEAAMRKAIELDPTREDFRSNLGDILFHQDMNSADEYRKAVDASPDNPRYRKNLFVALRAGSGAKSDPDSELKKAQDGFKSAIAAGNNVGEAHYGLGTLLFYQGSHADAEKEYRAAISSNGDRAEYYYALGTVLCRLNKHQDAANAYHRAIGRNPNKADYHNGLGVALFALKKYQSAEAEFKKAIAIYPDNAIFHYNLSDAFDRQNRTREATAESQKAQEVGAKKTATYHSERVNLGVDLN